LKKGKKKKGQGVIEKKGQSIKNEREIGHTVLQAKQKKTFHLSLHSNLALKMN